MKKLTGGHHQINSNNKVVVQYEQPELGECCYMYIQLLWFYLSKLPERAFQLVIFYWKAHVSIPASAIEQRYMKNPFGHNTYAQFLKRIFDIAGTNRMKKNQPSPQSYCHQ